MSNKANIFVIYRMDNHATSKCAGGFLDTKKSANFFYKLSTLMFCFLPGGLFGILLCLVIVSFLSLKRKKAMADLTVTVFLLHVWLVTTSFSGITYYSPAW